MIEQRAQNLPKPGYVAAYSQWHFRVEKIIEFHALLVCIEGKILDQLFQCPAQIKYTSFKIECFSCDLGKIDHVISQVQLTLTRFARHSEQFALPLGKFRVIN